MRKGLQLLLCQSMILMLCACNQNPASDRTTISVIPKGTTHAFWQSVHAGAVKASQELGVEILWVGTEKEDDRQQQIALVDNQVMNQVDGIVLAPQDGKALRRPVKAAVDKNVPVVIIDSGLEDSEETYASFVATDNREGGRLAGRELARLLNGAGKVIMLRCLEGSASTDEREAGFLEAIAAIPAIEVVSHEQYGGATTAQALQVSENLLLRFKDAEGDLTIQGIFCPNESTTFGMLQALRRNRQAGKVRFVGFDAAEALVTALRQGEIDGLVVQNPFKMGYLGVKTMVQHLRGETVEKRIDTGVTFVTATNIDTPEIQTLLNPELAKSLGQ
jgi:ribose transport system substrate-binding protein